MLERLFESLRKIEEQLRILEAVKALDLAVVNTNRRKEKSVLKGECGNFGSR